MKRSTITLLAVLIAAMQLFAYEKQSIDIYVNGQKRNMVVFTPNTLPAKSPLLIVTHGMNQDPEYQYGSDKIYEMIDTAKFVVTYLRSDGNTWDTGGTKDQNFVIKTIDEMAARYNIDRDRVYWSGFSMGSMLIHHCMPNMQDKIAAFAPTSGIQFSEEPWNNCHKPVNLLECIAYGDDVFGYEQYGIHAYIENYALHDQHTRYSKTVGFRPFKGAWQDGDMEKWTGGPNGGEVWLYSYNNGGHWPTDQNRHLIWNFCKRFTLNQPRATITKPAGESTYLYITPTTGNVFPDIPIEATAKATGGQIEKVEFFDGNTLIATQTSQPFATTLTAPKAGIHELRIVVTDSNGKKGEASCTVNCIETSGSYDLAQTFTAEGVVPQNWYVTNGRSKRVGGGLPYNSGTRLLHFTNSSRAFEYGLLVLNSSGKENYAWARFGDSAARSYLKLHAGHYVLKNKVVNWNCPQLSPVTYTIEKLDGQQVASMVYTPAKNVGANTANSFSSGRSKSFEFDIDETGDYVISYYAAAEKDADFVLGMATLEAKSFSETGISEAVQRTASPAPQGCIDLSGRRISAPSTSGRPLSPGLYIINGRKVVISQ